VMLSILLCADPASLAFQQCTCKDKTLAIAVPDSELTGAWVAMSSAPPLMHLRLQLSLLCTMFYKAMLSQRWLRARPVRQTLASALVEMTRRLRGSAQRGDAANAVVPAEKVACRCA